ncbi:hypothetical protein HDV06_002515 [Boothiomyces sp. JEL0866]|nr:hypothetical protein HDV06_002515 [Boothiomyces sp. JEL0866]
MQIVTTQTVAYLTGVSATILISNIVLAIYRLYQIKYHEKKRYRFWILVLNIASLVIYTVNYSYVNTVDSASLSKANFFTSRIAFAIVCASQTALAIIKHLQPMINTQKRDQLENFVIGMHLSLMVFGIVVGIIDVVNGKTLPPPSSVYTQFQIFYYSISSTLFGCCIFSVNIVKAAISTDKARSEVSQGINILWTVASIGNTSILLQTVVWGIILWNILVNQGTLWVGCIAELGLNCIFFIKNASTILTKELCSEKSSQSPRGSPRINDSPPPVRLTFQIKKMRILKYLKPAQRRTFLSESDPNVQKMISAIKKNPQLMPEMLKIKQMLEEKKYIDGTQFNFGKMMDLAKDKEMLEQLEKFKKEFQKTGVELDMASLASAFAQKK